MSSSVSSKSVSLLNQQTSEFISFIRLFMIGGLVLHHIFSIPGEINYPRSGMAEYDSLIPAAVNSFLHYSFMTSVPLLSIISGFLFATSFAQFSGAGVKKIFVKKLKTLLFPMLFWCSLWFSFGFLVYWLSGGSINVSRDPYYDFSNMDWLYIPNALFGIVQQSPYAFQFWFIHDLVLTFILAPLIFAVSSSRIYYIGLGVITFLLWFKGFTPPGMYNSNVLFFFIVGGVCNRIGFNVFGDWISKYYFIPLIFGIGFVVALAMRAWNYALFEEGSFLARNIDTFIYLRGLRCLGVVTFLGLLWWFSHHLTTAYNFISKYSTKSFWIYAVHFPVIFFVKWAFEVMPLQQTAWFQVLSIFLITYFTIVVSLALGALVNRISPQFYSLINGGRS